MHGESDRCMSEPALSNFSILAKILKSLRKYCALGRGGIRVHIKGGHSVYHCALYTL